MKYTNKLNLPQAIVEAVKNDDYDSGNSFLTATQLNKPVQMVKLEKEHKDDIIEDISDNIYALMGKAIHYILEKAESIMPVEKRKYCSLNDTMISCQLDRLALISKNGGFTGKIQDYKMASVWQYIYGLNKEYEEQLNVIAFILKANNYKISQLEIVMIFRDWQKSKAKYDSNYPQQQIVIIPIKLWSIDEQATFIDNKIQQYKAENIPECTAEERWNNGDKYAVMKKGRKKALKVFDSKHDAYNYLESIYHENLYIEDRPGENKRCENYCKVKNFCKQYKSMS